MQDIETLLETFKTTLRMMLFDNFKTKNPLIDGILTTIILAFFGRIFHIAEKIDTNYFKKIIKKIKLFTIPSKIKITGQSFSCATWGELYISSAYSNRFNAVREYIIENRNINIYELKETLSYTQVNGNKVSTNGKYIVSQEDSFSIDTDIYFLISSSLENEEHNKQVRKVESTTIEIYSYVFNIDELTKYVENITKNYMENVMNDRKTKKYIYTTINTHIGQDETTCDLWSEQEFQTNRNFDNIFLEDKEDLLCKIDFFLNNKEWYDSKGIPYTLGIGLHGPPGTGKTSFIKALASKTKRDIIILPLKIVNSKRELNMLFYENRYNINNEMNSKTFDKKIIVFEDIDCIGDIVEERKTKKKKKKKVTDNQENMVVSIKDMVPDPLTLDDFLNLWDGVRETPGRIIIITSNHYDKLDKALIRPGRIDICYEFKNANRKVISDMYNSFFGKNIEESVLSKIPEYKYSPAEITNIFMKSRDDDKNFIQYLINNM